ncbi:MAG: D-alanyl-D-alanine carboxypeptidase [Clostridia bacterium]|nr:D-alanyl-D-alanine carboxypeptidase [Clostridia bacterium]
MAFLRRRGPRFVALAVATLLFWNGTAARTAAAALQGVSQQVPRQTPQRDPRQTLPTAPGPEAFGLAEKSSAILMDAQSGQVLFAHNADDPRPPASVTKLMTLSVIFDALQEGRVRLDDPVTTSDLAYSFGGTQIYLEPGEVMPLRDLLYAIAIFSANDAAVAAAEHVAGSVEAFVHLMNQKSAALGMRNSRWANPHGLPVGEQNLTTARDLAVLSRYIVTRQPEILRYTSTWEYWVRRGKPNAVWLTNFNDGLVEYRGMDGLKTGWTNAAGYCLAATAAREGRRLIAVVLGAPSVRERQRSIYRLLDYGFSAFQTVRVLHQDQPVAHVRVLKGTLSEVPLVAAGPAAVTVRRGEKPRLERRLVGVPRYVTAPVRRGQVLGHIEVLDRGRLLTMVEAVAAKDVGRAGWPDLFGRYWRALWHR